MDIAQEEGVGVKINLANEWKEEKQMNDNILKSNRLNKEPGKSKRQISATTKLRYQGENPNFQEYATLSEDAQLNLWQIAKGNNKEWLAQMFTKLQVGWLIVIDGKIIKHGSSLGDFPKEEEILRIGEQIGKVPFVFLNDNLLAIEEGQSGWHATGDEPADFYPTLPARLRGDVGSISIVGDFDTGSRETFVDFDMLLAQSVTRKRRIELRGTSWHLSSGFNYVLRNLTVELAGTGNVIRRVDRTIVCVLNWTNSPFVRINPNRTALIGRGILFDIKPKVILDFDICNTTIEF